MVARTLFVREKVSQLQSVIGKGENDIIMIGRDIGTVIMPNADVKFFLDANLEVRAKRKFMENHFKSYEYWLDNLRKRDESDINREHGPLLKAKDAFLIQNDNMSIEETSDFMIEIIKSVINK